MKCSLIEVTLKHSLKISFNGKPLGFLSGALRCIVSGFSFDVSGHKVGKRWGHHHRAQPTPWLPPSSYKRSPLLPLTTHSSPSSHMPLGWHLLPFASYPVSRVRCLGEALLKIFSTTITTMS